MCKSIFSAYFENWRFITFMQEINHILISDELNAACDNPQN